MILSLSLLLLAGCGDSSSSTRTLVLLHTNDEHSHLLGFQPEEDDFPTPSSGTGTIQGGIARRATLLAQERMRLQALGKDAASLTVSAGDNTMGTLVQVAETTAAPDFVMMKQLGYDVTIWGNHEFDYGPKGLAKSTMTALAAGGVTPTVSTNVHFSTTDAADDELAALFDESGHDASKPAHRFWVVTAANGLKVGFVGVMGADAQQFATVKAPVTFSVPPGGVETNKPGVITQIAEDVQPIVDKLRNDEKCDVVVALSHSGVDPAEPEKGEDYQLARNVSGLDVIVSGHTHTSTAAFTVTNPKTMKPVVVQEAGRFGDTLGKITLTVDKSGVHWDAAGTALIDVDDKVAADPAVAAQVSTMVGSIETTKLAGGKSFLEAALSNVTGMSISDDASTVGDLYFYPLATTAFDLPGEALRKETPLLVLSADAQLAAADQFSGGTTDLAVQVAGVIRGDLPKGKTGKLGFGDVFRILPLGISTADGTVGYPLTRFNLILGEIKAALEASASAAYSSQDLGAYYMVSAGARYEYDTSRPVFSTSGSPIDPNNGRVTKIIFASDHSKPDTFDKVVFDVTQPDPWVGGVLTQYTVVTNLYVAQFASSFGIKLKKPDGSGKEFASPTEAIIKRPDGSEIKDYEALAAFIRTQAMTSGGALPSRWNAAATPAMFPTRAICAGPLCTP
jgi:5'-nucleotidase / UDP-sugar diphosphatase